MLAVFLKVFFDSGHARRTIGTVHSSWLHPMIWKRISGPQTRKYCNIPQSPMYNPHLLTKLSASKMCVVKQPPALLFVKGKDDQIFLLKSWCVVISESMFFVIAVTNISK